MRIWIGLLSLSADISSTSDIIRRGLTAIGSQRQKVDGHTSAMSCDVWRVGESIDNALTGRMVVFLPGAETRELSIIPPSHSETCTRSLRLSTFMGRGLLCD